MKKLIILVIFLVVIAVVGLSLARFVSGEDSWICQDGQWVKHGNPTKPKPASVCGEIKNFEGTIKEINIESNSIKIISGQTEINLIVMEDAKLSDSYEKTISLGDIFVSFEVSGSGSIAGENKINVSELKIIRSPNIVLYGPDIDAEIGLPVEIRGIARVFENSLNLRIKDDNGTILAETNVMANSPDIGKFGPFKISLNYAEPKTEKGLIEAFDYSAKDGEIQDLVSVPIRFKKVEAQTVKVFFSSSTRDPKTLYCNKTYPVERRIAKTETPARAAMEELLLGVMNSEAKSGFTTSINSGVEINKLTIEKGIAKIDFSDSLGSGVGGSCRVAAIRSQIVNTLKQFSTVKDVIISIEGETEEILQP